MSKQKKEKKAEDQEEKQEGEVQAEENEENIEIEAEKFTEDMVEAPDEDGVPVVKKEPEETVASKREKRPFDKETWNPKTRLGMQVKSGEITEIDQILDNGMKILEAEVVDALMPDLESDLLLIGQSKGKFGGGQRRIFKQTQKKTKEGNKPQFATCAVVGNRNGYVGIGYGKSKETVPAREKALRRAKISVFKIRRGCASWLCDCPDAHTVPFKVEGKCGSVKITLLPAPKGKGLCVESECQKILALAGIKDVWSKTQGQTKTKTNLVFACVDALKKLMETKIGHETMKKNSICEGKIAGKEQKVA